MDVAPGTTLCSIDAIPDGKALSFAFGEDRERVGIVVVRRGDMVRAYVNRCPHFQIPLDVGRGIHTFRDHVLCANHYAVFRFEDGYCVDGPCLGASLEMVPIQVSENQIMIAAK